VSKKQKHSGVSPVIGVILMVAVTVALVALVTVVVFDLGGDVSDSPDATVQLEQSESSGNDTVSATILRNENVDTLYLAEEGASDPTDTSNDEVAEIGSAAGDSATLEDGDGSGSSDFSFTDGNTFNVIAVMPDGSQEVLTSTNYEA
jgi:flagellin-like protein